MNAIELTCQSSLHRRSRWRGRNRLARRVYPFPAELIRICRMSTIFSKNLQRLTRFFLAGLLAVLPVVITVAIVAWVAGFVRQILGPRTLIGEGLIAWDFNSSPTIP